MEVSQYHSQRHDWRNTASTKVGELYGIELEVEHPIDRQDAADSLDDFITEGHPPPVVERDGSLDPQRGLEVICPPLTRAGVLSPDGYIARIMHRLRDSGVDAAQGAHCGMHVNVNVVDWTPQEKLLVQWCLNAFKIIVSTTGRRGPTVHGVGSTFGEFRPVLEYKLDRDNTVVMHTYPGSKHCAAWLRQPAIHHPAGRGNALVLEARFPRSTLEIKDLHAAIDLITAVRDWVRVAPNHTQACALLVQAMDAPSLLELLFAKWCEKHRPNVLTGYDMPAQQRLLQGRRGKRLELITRAYEEQDRFEGWTGFRATEHGDKEQILRISTLVGKGARLEGEPLRNEWAPNFIDPATVRAAR